MRGLQKRGTVETLIGLSETGVAPTKARGGSRRLSIAVLVAAVVVAADQLTKWWAVDRLSRGPIHVIGPINLRLERNTGSAFSLLQGDTVLLVIVAALLVVCLFVFVVRSPSSGRAAALGLVIGGALGNLSDRFFRGDHGAVVDFVALRFWPTFNLADSCIVAGCALVALSLTRGAR